MLKRLQDKVALVTGGSRGIGRAICEVFAREGASVIVNYSANAEKAESLVTSIKQAGGRAIAVHADVSSPADIESLVATATKQFGHTDILVNNAGILTSGSVVQFNEADFDRLMAVNLKGVIHSVKAVAPGMIERRYGKIINLSSIAGFGTAVPETTPYAITKAAVISLTKRLALELGPHGINVNAIAPGFVRTEMLQFLDNENDRARLEMLAKRAMLNRVGAPEDIANAALFLASDESSYMTAQVLTIDGGRTDFLTHSS
jgi:Dehydrogenases with different specificities (related to short-chain alcohol dehydrogenases)